MRVIKIVVLLSLAVILALALLVVAGINRWFDPATSANPNIIPQLGARPSLCKAQDWLLKAAASVAPPIPDKPIAKPYWLARDARRDANAALNSGSCQQNTGFFIGTGKSDITGVSLGQNMLGYADEYQLSAGIHTRQYARAFAIASGCTDRRVLLIALDQGLMFHSVRQGVLAELAADNRLAQFYNADNVMLSVSHSHSTAGGQAHYDLYNLTAGGHDPQSYQALVDGVMAAIRRAHDELHSEQRRGQPVKIHINQAELLNTIVQRSPEAYAKNPAAERRQYLDTDGNEVSVNRLVTLLRLRDGNGKNIGMLNWFAIHGTSMGQTGVLLSGDNKGYAQQLIESDYGDDFLAAFMQADEGDNSPNPHIMQLSDRDTRNRHSDGFHRRGGGANDYDSTAISGYKQANHARTLFETASEPLVGDISSQSILIDMSSVQLEGSDNIASDSSSAPLSTCKPALGISFAAGAEDGRGPLREGQACDVRTSRAIDGKEYGMPRQPLVGLGCHLLNKLDGYGCHAEKPIFVPLTITALDPQGKQPLGPSVQTLQIITIGNLAIIAMPWEVTTMSGRRIRDSVLNVLETAGIDYAVIAGLANGDGRYLTTAEEYSVQQYEGASTLYGPWTLAALQQEYGRLAEALWAGQTAKSPFAVNAYRTRVTRQRDLHIADNPLPKGANYGDVLIEPKSYYSPSDNLRVEASFRAAHPRHDLRNNQSYLEVQRLVKGQWQTIANDNSLNTRLLFYRDAAKQLIATVEWHPQAGDQDAQYRIRLNGRSAQGIYTGDSQVFEIGPCGE